ncbi:MAG TPA: hypothetical protein VJT31_37725 [Rugosimonospora sp.]|nr:hypothetical protein [Rugosimonospora sp.]
MATLQTLRDPTGRWRVERVFDRTDVDYRVLCDGRVAAEVGSRDDLKAWLARVGVDIAKLKPVREGWDPFPIM